MSRSLVFLLACALPACLGNAPSEQPGFGVGPRDDDETADVLVESSELAPLDTLGGGLFREGPPIPFLHTSAVSSADRYTYGGGGGIAVFDADADGTLDVLMTNHLGCNALFANDGTGTFLERPISAELSACDRQTNAVVPADLDGDGALDLLVAHQRSATGEEHLVQAFLGRTDGTFAPPVTVPNLGRAYGLHTADLDGDGDLDVFIVNFADGLAGVPPEDGIACNALWLGRGDGGFDDGSAGLPAADCEGFGMMASVLHNDSSGLLDLYVVNDKGDFFGPDHYSRNVGGGEFEDRSVEVGFAQGGNAMGIAPSFIDERLSMFVGGGGPNRLLSLIAGSWVDVTASLEVDLNDSTSMGWAGTWYRPDLLLWGQGNFGAGPGDDAVLKGPELYALAEGRLALVPSNGSTFHDPTDSHGYLVSDFNADGCPDVINMQVDHTRAYGVFFGTSCAAPLSVELVDRDGNPPTGIRITFEGVSQIYGSGMGLFGAATPRAFFEGPGELTIGWASGRSSRVSLEAGRHYRLVESPR